MTRKKWRSLNKYPSRGTTRIRFSWGEGGQTLGQMDIRGGNASNPIVKKRAEIVQGWIDQGFPTLHIQQLLISLPRARAGRPRKAPLEFKPHAPNR
jgi:hypothetical protein